MLQIQPLSLTFNVFLTVFVSGHINEGTLQVNHEALQFTFYSTVPVTRDEPILPAKFLEK